MRNYLTVVIISANPVTKLKKKLEENRAIIPLSLPDQSKICTLNVKLEDELELILEGH